jgi:CO/xanthine dehydrogenase FAD-binding subunit
MLSGAEASFTLSSSGRTRVLFTDDFFNMAGGTHIAPDEILTAITLPPLHHWSRLVFEKFRYRTFEAAIGLVAVGVALQDDGKISRIRIAIGAVAKAPSVACRAASFCLGKSLDELDVEAVATAASHEALPPADALTRQQKYQSELTISLIKRAFARLRAGDAA